MNDKPMPFDTAEWLANPDLRACSMGARAVYFELRMTAWQLGTVWVLGRSDCPWTAQDAANVICGHSENNLHYIEELQRAGLVRVSERQGRVWLPRLLSQVWYKLQHRYSDKAKARRLRAQLAARYDETMAAIVDRDGPGCRHCGSEVQIEIDHIRPIARGGDNRLANLQLLCKPCNLSKHARWDGTI